MAGNTEARRILPGDPEYDIVFAGWVKNQRPSQFDAVGSWGGHIYQVPDTTLAQPVFIVAVEAGPTEFDDELPGGPITLGFAYDMMTSGQVRIRASHTRGRGVRLIITKIPLPRIYTVRPR
jgi:hypothetical protein